MKLIDGKKIAEKNLRKIKGQVTRLRNLGISPKLAVVLVGDDKASLSYIRKKEESCCSVGIDFELFKFPENISEDNLLKKLDIVQRDKKLTGLIIQLPLPKKLNARRVLDHIKPELDVDCLTSYCLGKLTANDPMYIPPTADAVLDMLDEYNVKFDDKHIVVVGRGALVGKPLVPRIIFCNKHMDTANLKNVNIVMRQTLFTIKTTLHIHKPPTSFILYMMVSYIIYNLEFSRIKSGSK